MNVNKVKAITKYSGDELGNVVVREVERFVDDEGNVVSETPLPTKLYKPGDDTTDLYGVALDVVKAAHTPERIAKEVARQAAEKAFLQAEAKRRMDAIKAGQGTKPAPAP